MLLILKLNIHIRIIILLAIYGKSQVVNIKTKITVTIPNSTSLFKKEDIALTALRFGINLSILVLMFNIYLKIVSKITFIEPLLQYLIIGSLFSTSIYKNHAKKHNRLSFFSCKVIKNKSSSLLLQ